MSGKYIKEIHACNKPERLPTQNIGTVWQCDCGKIYELNYIGGNVYVPSAWSWRYITPEQWDAENLKIKPITYEFVIPERKKKWWQK